MKTKEYYPGEEKVLDSYKFLRILFSVAVIPLLPLFFMDWTYGKLFRPKNFQYNDYRDVSDSFWGQIKAFINY